MVNVRVEESPEVGGAVRKKGEKESFGEPGWRIFFATKKPGIFIGKGGGDACHRSNQGVADVGSPEGDATGGGRLGPRPGCK